MRRMLAARAALPVPDVAGALGARLDFHKDEADAMAALAKANVILECCEHHFSGVKRQHGFREDKVDNLEHHCVDIQVDFMENMTTPLGPEEAQDWFWATARQSITTLGFYAHYWLNGVEHHQYFHFISDILNHDSAFAVQAFGDLLLRLGLSDQRTVLHVFADCGPHFRSYEFLWCLVEVCKSKFPTVFLHFLLERHGKGRNDGQFGLQRRWAVDYARDHVISDVSDMKGALEAGAMMTMSLDPPQLALHITLWCLRRLRNQSLWTNSITARQTCKSNTLTACESSDTLCPCMWLSSRISFTPTDLQMSRKELALVML
ncbi:unnamed protein product [Polarella glacialis]|uniref:Uncharacterized protein n=1 Tax=Polarella glacialis TaxID=89957 RepID=A0A813JQB3_POLGL|nr:unnamed protein product [Polarella glacialis]